MVEVVGTYSACDNEGRSIAVDVPPVMGGRGRGDEGFPPSLTPPCDVTTVWGIFPSVGDGTPWCTDVIHRERKTHARTEHGVKLCCPQELAKMR